MKKNSKNNNKKIILLLVLVLGISIGYAALASNLKINGISKVKSATWKVYWDNVQISDGSVTTSDENKAQITDTEKTQVEYSVVLNEPGDYYEFTVDAVNAGTIDAMIAKDGIVNGVYSDSTYETSAELPKAVKYTVTYADGKEIEENHLLRKAGDNPTKETYKVRVEYSEDIDESDLDSANDKTYYFKFSVEYVQADSSAKEVRVVADFETSSWKDIASSYASGSTEKLVEAMNNGTTREIDMGSFGKHKIRIANITPCTNGETSETACGLVLEFADIITTHAMNSSHTNVGGWEASSMRSYINSDIYNALPGDLRNAITTTKVISGHGSTSGESNFETNDNLYLLSTKEVYGKAGYDTVDSETRQLDYYKNKGVTLSNYSGAIKQYNNSNSYWWLRAADSSSITAFTGVNINGSRNSRSADLSLGVSPAFRIQ